MKENENNSLYDSKIEDIDKNLKKFLKQKRQFFEKRFKEPKS